MHAHNRPRDIDTQFRELAHRSDNGVDVTLSWHAETDELLVCVYDERREVYFEIHPERAFALDIFYHPYAHGGLRRRWASRVGTDQGRDQ